MSRGQWAVERTDGPAGPFHHRPHPTPLRPTVWIHRVERPALVLGSTQRAPLVDAERAERDDIEVCQRRSGGGLVLVDPDTSLWIDAFVPRGHALWSDDVGLAFDWIGQTWATAVRTVLADAGGETDVDVNVHRGPMEHADWGRTICFAGIGSGEVMVDHRKVVGLSQRRMHDVARFQGLAVTNLDVPSLRRYLVPGALPPDLDAALDALPVGIDLDLGALADCFLSSLPTT